MAPDTPRIKLIGAISGSGDLKAARSGMEGFLATLRGPRPPIRFSRPHSVAIHEPDLLAVADASGGAVHLIHLEQRTHRLVSGWRDGRFEVPIGVAWAGDRLFVTDAGRGEVIELDAQGRYHHRFGGKTLGRPVGITYVPSRSQLYVVDGDAHRIAVFDLSGKFVRTIGRPGVEPGTFNYPTQLCCAGDKLLVADSGNFRVQLLDLDGRCERTIGQKGNGAGDFALPKGVAFDREGHIYVVDAHFENIQVFNDQGRLLMAFGREGRGAGRFSLPAGLTIDARDRIWVADSGNRRLQVFAYLRTAS
jgi:DNA-binding beta-propeller fold protein YncE